MDKYIVAVHKTFNDISVQILIYNILKAVEQNRYTYVFYLNIDMLCLLLRLLHFGLFFLRTIIQKIMVMAQSFNVKK